MIEFILGAIVGKVLSTGSAKTKKKLTKKQRADLKEFLNGSVSPFSWSSSSPSGSSSPSVW